MARKALASYITMPKAYTSLLAVALSPRTTSGASQVGLRAPAMEEPVSALPSCCSSRIFDRLKSPCGGCFFGFLLTTGT